MFTCRQKKMELAATALVAATLEDKEKGESDTDSEAEYEGIVIQTQSKLISIVMFAAW